MTSGRGGGEGVRGSGQGEKQEEVKIQGERKKDIGWGWRDGEERWAEIEGARG